MCRAAISHLRLSVDLTPKQEQQLPTVAARSLSPAPPSMELISILARRERSGLETFLILNGFERAAGARR